MKGSRICSLLPSATEIVCALGLADRLVAVTHECDFPPEVASLPQVTSSVILESGLTSRQIDEAIKRALSNLSTIYELNRPLLAGLAPDLILTQELCEVCAVSFSRVQDAARAVCPGGEVVSLEPDSIEGIFETIRAVGKAAEADKQAETLIDSLRERCERVRNAVADATMRPRVLTLEWLDPPFLGGHWVPEMIELAGGEHLITLPGERSPQITWENAIASEPDIVILMPCGYDLRRTIHEVDITPLPDEFLALPAVREGHVFAVNGSAHFNRPGPRVVDGIEITARILHPELFGEPNPWEAVRVTPRP